MKKILRIALFISAAVPVLAAAAALLFFTEKIKLNTPSQEEYPVRGVDVSSYQGEIDWGVLSEGLDFAYIKATEGSRYTDDRFAYNYEQARKTGLRVGAYHFFSFESSGASQAENFISQVAGYEGMLPPVIDVELYGSFRDEPRPAEDIIPELRDIVSAFEAHYGTKPVFYSTGSAYRLYIRDNFPGCGLWIRDVFTRPSGDMQWDFWQYSGKGLLRGYDGEEKYIDLDVFRGTKEEFEAFCQ